MRMGRRPARRRLLIALAAIVAAAAVTVAVALTVTDLGDRLPLPWRPTNEAKFPAATACARCHPAQVAAWQVSSHARAAHDPLVHASICGRCHAPVGTMLDPEYQLKEFDKTAMPGMPSSAAEGITCVTCHAPTHVPDEQVLTFEPVWPNWRTTDLALEIRPFDAALGTFGAGTAADPPPVPNDGHPSRVDPNLSSAELCRPCHNVVVDKGPLAPHAGLNQARVRLLTTYDEWAASPYAALGQTCQSCHMPRDRANGPAAVAPPGTTYQPPLPARPLASHTITGLSTEYLTAGPAVDLEEQRVADRLKGAAIVQVHVPGAVPVGGTLAVSVTMTNTGAGHDLPTGFAYWSEAWLEVTATDAGGRQLLASGDVDAAGWLRDEFNPRVRSGALAYDAYLVSLRARLVTVGPNRAAWLQPDGTLLIPPEALPRNLNGTPILGTADYAVDPIVRQLHPDAPLAAAGSPFQEGYVLRFADTIVRNGIPAQQSRTAHYQALVAPTVRGPIRVTARLLIRALWPWMLQQQAELPTPRPQPRVYEIASALATIPVSASGPGDARPGAP
jgi:hypothetical protein